MSDTKKNVSRGRPRKFDRDAGVRTVISMFAETGYDVLGISKICSELGIKPTSLYSAYGSKAGLFSEAVALYANEDATFPKLAAEVADTPHIFVREVLMGAVRSYCSTGAGCLVLEHDGSIQDETAAQSLTPQISATREFMVSTLRRLGDVNPERTSMTLMTMMRGLSGAAKTGASEDDLLQVVEDILPNLRTR